MTVTPHQRAPAGIRCGPPQGTREAGAAARTPGSTGERSRHSPLPLWERGAAEAEITPPPPTPTPSPTWGEGSNVPPLPSWERGAGG